MKKSIMLSAVLVSASAFASTTNIVRMTPLTTFIAGTNAVLIAANRYTDEHGGGPGGGINARTATNIAVAVTSSATNALASVMIPLILERATTNDVNSIIASSNLVDVAAATAMTNSLCTVAAAAQEATNVVESASVTNAGAKAYADGKFVPMLWEDDNGNPYYVKQKFSGSVYTLSSSKNGKDFYDQMYLDIPAGNKLGFPDGFFIKGSNAADVLWKKIFVGNDGDMPTETLPDFVVRKFDENADYVLTNLAANATNVVLASGTIANLETSGNALTVKLALGNDYRSCDAMLRLVNTADVALGITTNSDVVLDGAWPSTVKAGTNLVMFTKTAFQNGKSIVTATSKEIK